MASFAGSRSVFWWRLCVHPLHVPHQLVQIEPHHCPIPTGEHRFIGLHPTSAQAKCLGMLDQRLDTRTSTLERSMISGGGRCLMLAGRCTPSALIASASMALMLLAL